MSKKREREPSEILAGLSSGETIEDEETKELTARLSALLTSQNPDHWDFDEIYEVCIVLGRLRAPLATPLFEKLLDAQEAMTVSLVLSILCQDWNQGEYYLERVLTFAVGSVWDEEQDVQEKAIEILGELLARRFFEQKKVVKPTAMTIRVMDLLWQLFRSSEETPVVRQAAHVAILKTMAAKQHEEWEKVVEKLPTKAYRDLPQIQEVGQLSEEFQREKISSFVSLLP